MPFIATPGMSGGALMIALHAACIAQGWLLGQRTNHSLYKPSACSRSPLPSSRQKTLGSGISKGTASPSTTAVSMALIPSRAVTLEEQVYLFAGGGEISQIQVAIWVVQSPFDHEVAPLNSTRPRRRCWPSPGRGEHHVPPWLKHGGLVHRNELRGIPLPEPAGTQNPKATPGVDLR